jgi:hypothetical protein
MDDLRVAEELHGQGPALYAAPGAVNFRKDFTALRREAKGLMSGHTRVGR